MARQLFTSESVSMGHPDKVADQVSDAVLDACLAGDPGSRVACETLVTTNLCIVAGEITTGSAVDFEQIARDTMRRIGYTDADYGIDADSCEVRVTVHTQSPDIFPGRDRGRGPARRAGRRRSGPDVRLRL